MLIISKINKEKAWPQLSPLMRQLIEKLKAVQEAQGDIYEDDDDGDPLDDEFMFNPSEDMIYDSPLEKPEAALYFRDILTQIQASDEELYNSLVQCISEEQ